MKEIEFQALGHDEFSLTSSPFEFQGAMTGRFFRHLGILKKYVDVEIRFGEDIMICDDCRDELEEVLDHLFGDVHSSSYSDIPTENSIELKIAQRDFDPNLLSSLIDSWINHCELTHGGGWYDIIRW